MGYYSDCCILSDPPEQWVKGLLCCSPTALTSTSTWMNLVSIHEVARLDQTWAQKFTILLNGLKKIDACYVIGFAPFLRFLWSQILCRLYKSPLDETANRGPPSLYACKKDHIRMLKILGVPDRVRWIMETTKLTQHALKVSESS